MNTQADPNTNPYSGGFVAAATSPGAVTAPAANSAPIPVGVGNANPPYSVGSNADWAIFGLIIALLFAANWEPTQKGAVYFGLLLLAIVWLSVWQLHSQGKLAPFTFGGTS